MIREININELDQVLEIDRLVLKTNWHEDHYHTEIFNENSIFLVDIENDCVRGFLLVMVMGMDAEILQIAIHPNYQRQGIGRNLLSVGLEILKEVNVEYLSLEVRETNQQAINFYRSFDFIQTGVRKNYYGIHRNANIMRKRLFL